MSVLGGLGVNENCLSTENTTWLLTLHCDLNISLIQSGRTKKTFSFFKYFNLMLNQLCQFFSVPQQTCPPNVTWHSSPWHLLQERDWTIKKFTVKGFFLLLCLISNNNWNLLHNERKNVGCKPVIRVNLCCHHLLNYFIILNLQKTTKLCVIPKAIWMKTCSLVMQWVEELSILLLMSGVVCVLFSFGLRVAVLIYHSAAHCWSPTHFMILAVVHKWEVFTHWDS